MKKRHRNIIKDICMKVHKQGQWRKPTGKPVNVFSSSSLGDFAIVHEGKSKGLSESLLLLLQVNMSVMRPARPTGGW